MGTKPIAKFCTVTQKVQVILSETFEGESFGPLERSPKQEIACDNLKVPSAALTHSTALRQCEERMGQAVAQHKKQCHIQVAHQRRDQFPRIVLHNPISQHKNLD